MVPPWEVAAVMFQAGDDGILVLSPDSVRHEQHAFEDRRSLRLASSRGKMLQDTDGTSEVPAFLERGRLRPV